MLKSLSCYLKNKNIPFHITLFVTGRCMFKCKTCFYWHHINECQSELTLPEIKELAPQLKGSFWVAITGGEPFLRDDLGDILYAIHSKISPSYITISTNGFLPNKIEEAITKLFSINSKTIATISVSLDGIFDLHDDIRGVPGSFEKACESIRIIKVLQARFNKLRLRVCTCYNSFNQERIEEIPDFLKRRFGNIPWDFSLIRGIPHESASKNNLDIQKYFFLKQKYETALFDISKKTLIDKLIMAKSGILSKLQKKIIWGDKFNMLCQAGRKSIVIREQGEVIACEMEEFAMGDLRDFKFNFGQLYRSDQAMKTRQMIKDLNCRCIHECNLTTNMVFSMPSLLKFFSKGVCIKFNGKRRKNFA